MANHFHSIKIKKVIKETTDCISVVFDIPKELQSTFEFREGQNITIKKIINGEEIRRSYSICNAPYEQELKIAIKKVNGGLFSSFANEELSKNDVLDILPPTGKFSAHLSTKTNPNYLAIAAGSGITPVISIIKHTLHQQPNSKFTLVYGNKNRQSIIFFEELENLKNRFMDRFTFINILSKEKTDTDIVYGRIDEHKLVELNKIIDFTLFDEAYLCGPSAMIFSSVDYLSKMGMDKNRIRFELFNTPGQTIKSSTAIAEKEINKGPTSNVSIKLDGRTFSFNLDYNGINILDAALQQGADLPYACKGGVCCTCRAKLINGKVKMDVNYALEQEEIEQGFILTCQSHPVTENVIIDFDVK